MISSDIMRGYHDIMILSLLQEADAYGYALAGKIRERTRAQYVIKETTLYATVNRLLKNGQITAYAGSESYGKPRTYYSITDKGRALYREKAMEWREVQAIMAAFL